MEEPNTTLLNQSKKIKKHQKNILTKNRSSVIYEYQQDGKPLNLIKKVYKVPINSRKFKVID